MNGEGDDAGGAGRPPPWAGAPGYTPAPDLPPHAPMPGAPPYPARAEPPPPPVGAAQPRTRLLPVLGAAAVWAVVDLALVLVVGQPPIGAGFATGLALTVLLTTAGVALVARRRAWAFPLLLVAAAPVFWVLRAVLGALVG